MNLTFRVHNNMINSLNHFRCTLHFKSRSDIIRLAIIEAVYHTMRGKWKLRGALAGKTKVVGCRVPANIHRLIIGMNRKQRRDTISVWAALVINDWIEAMEKWERRSMKSPVYHGLCQDFTHGYRPQVDRLLLELDQLEPAK